MGCNMRCGHCGSSCAEALPDELTTDEAFSVIDDLHKLNLTWITLTGGEPLTRKDLPQLVERLSSYGIITNIITNGWMLDRKMVDALKKSGVCTVAISVDGTEKLHDSIRKPGSYRHLREAFGLLNDAGITKSAVTTISNKNIGILPQIRDELYAMKVDAWQVQLGLPMGNMSADWVIKPAQIDDIIDFCYETSIAGRISVYSADSIGYFTKKELQTMWNSFQTNVFSSWHGCHAGVRTFGILQNGDIVGCTSIRTPEFIEGNIKETRLPEIWNNPDSFAWRRKLLKNDLQGECRICRYGDICLGGCTDVRLTINGSLYSENKYCSYNGALKKLRLFSFEAHRQAICN